MDSGTATDGHVATADGSGGVAYEAPTGGGGGGGTVTTSAPVSGDGSAADPVTIANQAIGHTKLGSSVAGTDQAAGRILEADGAGDMRWADKGGGGGGGGDASVLESADLPTPSATNVYDVVNHLGVLHRIEPRQISQSVTWEASVDGDDVSDLWGESAGTYVYRGEQFTSTVTSPASGDVIILPTGGWRHRGATRWSHLGNPDGWIGQYVTEAEAEDHVTAANDLAVWGGNLQLVTAYTAGTTHYVLAAGVDALEVAVDTTAFSQNLTAADGTVQDALETIDSFTQYQGAWQQQSWPAGVIVRRNGVPYISLANSNTEIPTPASTQWSGLHEGFTYRGEAPVLATNYNYGQVVLDPDADVYYYFTSTISASVARADIAAHANFHPIGGGSLSDTDPADIADTPDEGTSADGSRSDHVHELPIDNTLEFDDSDQVGVNIHDVIEHLQERIQYKTDSTHYDSGGASVGQTYDTSAFRKTITKITALFEPLSGADGYVARLYEVAANNDIITKIADSNSLSGPFGLGATPRTFKFSTASGEAGVPISGGIRLAILVSRTGDDSDSDARPCMGRLRLGRRQNPTATRATISISTTAWSTSTSSRWRGTRRTRTLGLLCRDQDLLHPDL